MVFFEYLSKLQFRDEIERWIRFKVAECDLTGRDLLRLFDVCGRRCPAIFPGQFNSTGQVTAEVLGLERFLGDDTIRNFFKQFQRGENQRLYEPLREWQLGRVPERAEGYIVDLGRRYLSRMGSSKERGMGTIRGIMAGQSSSLDCGFSRSPAGAA